MIELDSASNISRRPSGAFAHLPAGGMGGGGFAIGLEGGPILHRLGCISWCHRCCHHCQTVDADAPVAPCLLTGTSCHRRRLQPRASVRVVDLQEVHPDATLGEGSGVSNRRVLRFQELFGACPSICPPPSCPCVPPSSEVRARCPRMACQAPLNLMVTRLWGHARLAVGRSDESDGRTGTSTCNGS